MLHRNVLVLHGPGLPLGGLKGLVHILGDVNLARLTARAGHLGQLLNFCLHRCLKAGDSRPHGGEELGDEALVVPRQGQQQVGLLDLLVAVLHGDILGPLYGGQGFLGKLIHVHKKHSFREPSAV